MQRLSRAGVAGHLVRIVDPAEEDFPYTGRTRFEIAAWDSDRRNLRPRRARAARLIAPASPPMAKRSRDAASRLGWTATAHRTDHAPQAALIALHAAIGGVDAERSWPERLFAALNLSARPGILLAALLVWRCRCCGGCCASPRPAPPHRRFRRCACCGAWKTKNRHRPHTPWWLLLLRLLAAALLIVALADPLLGRAPKLAGRGPAGAGGGQWLDRGQELGRAPDLIADLLRSAQGPPGRHHAHRQPRAARSSE